MKFRLTVLTTAIDIKSGPDTFDESRFVMTFLTILGVTEILCSDKLVLKGQTSKEITESSRLEFLEKFLAINFALSDAEDNNSRPLERTYSRFTFVELLAFRQKLLEPSFWEMMDFFVLLTHASLPASRTLLQQLLACLNFTLDSEDLFCWYKRKSDFYEL